ncbi:MAG TPA: flagellar export chaperone FliS [Tepidanaerobacter syntrophicus]|uniref:flagellar export chaperone FliS n=1 Tax=Tepidanaerobacter syntrophicus TaxID=224999 RepID=UPI00176F91FB|nr:flagellar export chaperone FliS [Tepidanaerobacter syntrophicus]HHV82398.1 flagellar export chaperone FliS [Tepidanaerobacter syntrophicus]
MINANGYQQYRYNSIVSASPERLMIMLFEGAIKFVRLAKKAVEEKDIESANYNIARAEDIIAELEASLDMSYEVSEDLVRIYDFLYRQLIEANIKKDINILDTVESMLADLKDTWSEACLRLKKNA